LKRYNQVIKEASNNWKTLITELVTMEDDEKLKLYLFNTKEGSSFEGNNNTIGMCVNCYKNSDIFYENNYILVNDSTISISINKDTFKKWERKDNDVLVYTKSNVTLLQYIN
jgi:hypothetical protein